MFLHPVTETEVLKAIDSLQTNKAIGDFDIPIKLIKMCKLQLSPLMLLIINKSFATGTFPDILKLAKVKPLYKKNDQTSMGNYRPVSILSSFSKIIEKIMKTRLISFLNKTDTLYKYQFGFRKGYSTKLALLEITEQIRDALDEVNYALGLYLDVSKAFETVNHTILLEKLYHYGTVHSWFKRHSSFLV